MKFVIRIYSVQTAHALSPASTLQNVAESEGLEPTTVSPARLSGALQ